MGCPKLDMGKWLGGMEEVGVGMVVGAGGVSGGGCSAGTSVPLPSEPMLFSESLAPVSKGMLCCHDHTIGCTATGYMTFPQSDSSGFPYMGGTATGHMTTFLVYRLVLMGGLVSPA